MNGLLRQIFALSIAVLLVAMTNVPSDAARWCAPRLTGQVAGCAKH